MGLDNFRTDDSSDVKDDSDDQASSDESEGGLMSFKTDDSTEEESELKWTDDLPASKWNSMSLDEKVGYIRDNYYPNFSPDMSVDERWTATEVNKVLCVCGEELVFHKACVCTECDRAYEDKGSRVSLEYEPHTEDGVSNNEQ